MEDSSDLTQATSAVGDPATSGAQLQAIAAQHPKLWPAIAAHPNAYPASTAHALLRDPIWANWCRRPRSTGVQPALRESVLPFHPSSAARYAQHRWIQAYPDLLDWLASVGDPDVQAAVTARRSPAPNVTPAPADAPTSGQSAAQTDQPDPQPDPPAVQPDPNHATPAQPPRPPSNTDGSAAKQWRWLIGGIGVGVVIVVVAVTLIFTTLSRGGGGIGSSKPLTVTGDAPAASTRVPTFLDGQETLAELPDGGDLIGTSGNKVLIQTSAGIGENATAIDKTTGALLWTTHTDWCLRGTTDRDTMVCAHETPSTPTAADIEWFDISNGQFLGGIDTTRLGDYIYDWVTTANGALFMVGAQPQPDDGSTVTIAYFTGPGKPVWATKVQSAPAQGDLGFNDGFDQRDGLFAWGTGGYGYLLDEQTGFLVKQYDRSDGSGDAQLFPGRLACTAYVDETVAEAFSDQIVNVPGGQPVTVKVCTSEDSYMTHFQGSGHPSVLITTDDGGGEIDGIDPAGYTGSQFLWQHSLIGANAWPSIDALTWDGDHTAFAASWSGRLWAFDVNTGQVLWWSTIRAEQDFADEFYQIRLSMTSGLIHVQGTSHDGAFYRSDTGQLASSFNTGSVFAWGDGIMITTNNNSSQLIVPAFSSQEQADQATPPDMPACPDGMSPVSWTKYDTGSILICQGSSYQVLLTDTTQPNLTPVSLVFNDVGYTITCADGTTLVVGAGASLVIITANGTPTLHAASSAWTPYFGQTTYKQTATGIPACPTNTWPISLSTWDGGWLLVCGTNTTTPTWLAYSDGVNTGDTSTVTTPGEAYCGDIPAGQVCAYAAPALVTLTNSKGTQQQHNVDTNFFPTAGAGGGTTGTGAYGINVPDPTAAAQAKYIEQILQASSQTRASLETVLKHLNNKQASNQDIATLQGVVDARNQQIAAVDGAPVTALPGGDALLATLREALAQSVAADSLYVTWGQQIQAQDWSAASATVAQWKGPAHQSEVLKQSFVTNWNKNFAPTYKLATFAASQI